MSLAGSSDWLRTRRRSLARHHPLPEHDLTLRATKTQLAVNDGVMLHSQIEPFSRAVWRVQPSDLSTAPVAMGLPSRQQKLVAGTKARITSMRTATRRLRVDTIAVWL
ncbi:hypothetical protein PPTG_10770 [Phytophthora nicotianae INRA-310]|uniref:Uncharacterized protein n=1 Tax=Phytophthora nicotianae (strain INRA-310) TaxID=761204 RepID=W2QAV5_PHYN3|nr:hypothetical protein PPTG_10770 [Phytophthora nicotianae INRA-310]ETN10001.1 hypothetical protein PPTG_10770 [Phytophthora nicotianae INRA-310]